MAGKPYLRRGLAWVAVVGCSFGLALASGAWAATHYPPGAICYDCHAVSKSKMVAGTHLLKKSDRSVALGIDQTNPQAPCLFCHDRNATPSVVNRDRMKGVWDHFDATSTSKHRAEIRSGFGDQASLFDCRDCHTGIDLGVVSDGAGNARVHGIDASGSTRLNVPSTLVGWRASGYSLSEHTCGNAACHGGAASNSYGTYAARPAHGMGTTTLAGGATPTACTQCHGTHNSYRSSSILTLRVNGEASNDLSNLTAWVTPSMCGVCHVQDDAGTYAAKGHGQSTISGGSIGCTACHTGSVAHSYSKDAPGNNPLRFAFAENTSVQSAIRQQAPYNQVYSICGVCHSQYQKSHGKSEFAGCNDCHEPHGAGVADNIAMVRSRIPKVNPGGDPIYGESGVSGAWETIVYTSALDAYRTDGQGLCDNAECHQGRQSPREAPLYPLATLLGGDGHSEGTQEPGSNCQNCHKHLDSSGSWGARDSCTSCHGQPPPPAVASYNRFSEVATGHRKHAGDGVGQYGYDCAHCHGAYPGSHLNGGFQDVVFGALNSSGSYNPGPATCAGLYCHSDGQSALSAATSPAWDAGALNCRSCHGGVEGSTRIATVSHPQHLASGSTCVHCHSDTVATVGTDTTTPISGLVAHVNGVKNLKAGGTFAGQAVTFATGGATTCSTISCHNGGSADWGAALACSDCHFRTAAQGGDRDNFVYGDGVLSAVSSDEWANTGHGRPASGPAPSGNYPSGNPAANFSGPAADPRGCAYCHDPAVGHGVSTNPFRLANQGVRSGTGNEHRGWNDACLVCHGTGSTGYDPDGTGGAYTGRDGTRNVGENHYGTKHGAGRNGGAFCWDCHDPHGDDQHYMVQGGAGVTSHSDGLYGIPVTRRQVTGFNVVSGGYTSSDLVNDNFSGLCQTCHTVAAFYNQSTNTPLADHNSAHTTHCTECHTHDNDFGAGCTSCHGYPPPESPFGGTTVTWTSDKAAAPATLGLHSTHAAGATPYVTGGCFLTCHTGDTHLTNKTTADMGVKAATVGASTGIYRYSTLDNFDVWTGGALPGNQSVVDDTCTNVNCHASTYGSPANQYRSAANPGYTRYWNATLNCYACHAYNGVTAAAPRPTADKIATGSHAAHADTYALACTNCHPSGAYTNAHKDGFVSFVTNFGATRVSSATGGFYDLDGIAPFSTVANLVPRQDGGTGYFCASVYCHSSGEPRGPETIVYRNDTRWTQAATGTCGTCHAVDAVPGSGSLTTNVHEKHVGSAAGQYGYDCSVCHATVVGGTKPDYTIASTALHVNGANNVVFGANEGTYSQATGGTVAPAGGTCSTTYCHSRGLDRSAPYTGTATAPVTTADWDTAQGTAGCGYCHGNPPAYANNITFRPNAIDLIKKNSHAKHAGYTCDRCHYTTTQDGITIATVANHANKVWDVAPNTGAGVTFTVAVQGDLTDAAYTPTTCNTISCHGGGNAEWGATLTCFDCHVGTEPPEKPVVNAAPNPVNQAQYNNQGHGRTGTPYPGTGNPPAGYTFDSITKNCYSCHDNSVSHTPPPADDPFRLGAAYATQVDSLCLTCHGPEGTATKIDLLTHSKTTTGSAKTWPGSNYAFKCVDCHDPHGDANYAMVRSHISAPTATGDTSFGSNAYGTPNDAANLSAVTFTSLAGYAPNSYGISGATNGICEVCHTQTDKYLRNDAATYEHFPEGRCTSCHKHDGGFQGSGCSSCHGDGNDQYWPANAASNLRSAYPNRAGRHQEHMEVLGQRRYGKAASALTGAEQNAICEMCHNDASGVGGGTHYPAGYTWTAAPADVGAFNQMWGTYANDTDAAYAAATYGGGEATSIWTGGSTCSAVDCHNNKTTGTGFEWYGSSPTACTMCHTRATTGSNPSSGLHYGNTAPTVSAAWHDDTLTATNKCTVCHTTLTAQSTHINGVFQGGVGQTAQMGLFAAYTQTTDGVGSCLGAAVGGVGCHAGAGDAGTWARRWDATKHYATDGAECAGCHGDFASGWVAGHSPTHNRANLNATGNHETCKMCHLYPDASYGSFTWGAGRHGDGLLTLNSNATSSYQTASNGCTTICHANDADHQMTPDSGWTVQLVAGPGASCTSCHSSTGSASALGVFSTSSHTRVTRGGAFGDCTDCHSGHANGAPGANEVEVSTRSTVLGTVVPTMNREYASHGSRFRLGGSATKSSGWATGVATEAEICWGCHDAQTPAVTEWEINQNPSTGNLAYDYGSLYTTVTGTTKTSNWTTAFWRSGKGRSSGGASNPYWYKRGAIQSTHSVNFDHGTAAVTAGNTLGYNRTETKDNVANIRCSYCHDVHGTHDGVAGDPGGLPYLRGTWKGNPYPEDGAPQWGMANWTVDANTTLTFGRVPRGSAASNNSGLAGVPQAGGWWIDQNSGNPNAGETLATTAGLCIQCHGSNVDTMDHTTGENLWVSGGNGHMNAVIGGSGTTLAAYNIYTRTKRGDSRVVIGQTRSPLHDMGAATEYDRGYTYRDNDGSGYVYYPRIATTSTTASGTGRPYSFRYFPWSTAYNSGYTRGSTIASGTMQIQVADQNQQFTSTGTKTESASYAAQSKYHTFNCGKCHNPHASRLPKLLITNCLDTNHNTWDNAYQAAGAIGTPWASTRISQWAAAINCHRLDDRAVLSTSPSTVRGPGWNKVSPWLEFTSPDTTPSTNPNL